MTAPVPPLSTEQIRAELECLRRGPALGHPGAVRSLSPPLQELLLASQGSLTGQAEDVPRMVAALRRAIDALAQHERLHAQVEFNLLGEHSYPTLGQRQESLAALLGRTVKTVRRSASQAVDTLAMLIATGTYPPPLHNTPSTSGTDHQTRKHADLAEFWGLTDTSRVDIVCSELPPDTRSPTATPGDPHFMRYGQFADLDALFYIRVRLAPLFPQASIHDFAPSEYYEAGAGTLIVIGSPTWNSKHREFQPHLPTRFPTGAEPADPHLVVSGVDDPFLSPMRTATGQLLADLSVVTRITLADTTVFLLSGCLALGTLGAAKCFLRDPRGAGNARHITNLVGNHDFALITHTHRIGGITDTPDLTTTPPLLLLTRNDHHPFQSPTAWRPAADEGTRPIGAAAPRPAGQD